ncbi:MAG: TolC family protein [Syntrophaceae bacterium]|nr:TolC family protein [Syntrophaceae bacterium]
MKRIVFLACMMLTVLFLQQISPTSALADDYSLDEALRTALRNSEKILLSGENVVIAETTREKAWAVLIPKLTAYGGQTWYSGRKTNTTGTLIQPDEGNSWGVRVDQAFSLSGRELTALSISRDNIDKSRKDLDAVRDEILLQTVYAYFDVLKAGKSLEIADANLERLAKYRHLAEKRLRLGEVTKTALLRAEGELSGARADRIRAENGLSLTKAVLARVLGIKGPVGVKESAGESGEIPPLDRLLEKAITQRPELQALEIQKAATDKQIWYARGGYWPTVALSGVYQKTGQTPETASLNKETAYAAVSLNFPFFEGGLRLAEVKEAMARSRQAALALEDLKKTIGIEVEGARLDLVTQQGVLKFQQDQAAFARDNYQAVSRQYEFGLASSLDVIDANTLLVTSEQKLAEASINYQVSWLRMKRVTGDLLPSVLAKQ